MDKKIIAVLISALLEILLLTMVYLLLKREKELKSLCKLILTIFGILFFVIPSYIYTVYGYGLFGSSPVPKGFDPIGLFYIIPGGAYFVILFISKAPKKQ